MTIALIIFGLSLSGGLFGAALRIIFKELRKPVNPPDIPEYYAKYFDKLMTDEEKDYYKRVRW